MNNTRTYYFAAKVLSLGSAGQLTREKTRVREHADPAKTRQSIINQVQQGNIDWNGFVSAGSNNFVLQALYLKVLQNDLEQFLPPGLFAHLKTIHRLNHDRNKIILDHCSRINGLLRSGNIIPIFMKGAGNILDGLYTDPGERMMCDIDILTGPGQMEAAARLLMEDGYSSHELFDPSEAGAMKHFPALHREGLPAFVDIHRLPVNIQFSKNFDFEIVDREKRPATGNPDFMVMADRHKIVLSFYHSQLVHWGHQHARPSLRDLYDLLLLSGREDPASALSQTSTYSRKAAGYLRLMYKTFGIAADLPREYTGKGHGYLIRHSISLTSPAAGKAMYKLLRALTLYAGIPLRGLFNKNYRLYIMVRLMDREWYRRNLGISRLRGKSRGLGKH
jgi:hypothetical protein